MPSAGLVELARPRSATREARSTRAACPQRRRGLRRSTLPATEIVAADPFDAATGLQAAEAQLEALYTLTARLSRLSLTEYLR